MLLSLYSCGVVLYLLTSRQANEAELKRENEQLHLQLAEMSILARIRQSEDGEGESSEGKWGGEERGVRRRGGKQGGKSGGRKEGVGSGSKSR